MMDTYPTMIISQGLVRAYNLVEISVHELINNVNIVEVLSQGWSYYILHSNNLHQKQYINKKYSIGEIEKMMIYTFS